MFKNCLTNRISEAGAICTAQATQSSAQAVQRTAWPKPGWVDGGKGPRCQMRPTGWEFFSLSYPDWVISLMQARATLHYWLAAGACLNPPETLPVLSIMSFMWENKRSSRILIPEISVYGHFQSENQDFSGIPRKFLGHWVKTKNILLTGL